MNTTQKPPTRFLTYDEIITMPDFGGVEIPFRMRIWHGKHSTPVVLVSQYRTTEVSWLGPSSFTVNLANFVNNAVLRHPENGIVYFEDECDPRDDRWNLSQYSFAFYGNLNRLSMYFPRRRIADWERFEYLVGGGPIERLMY